MPGVNVQIQANGPIITAQIGVSSPRRAALTQSGATVPPSVPCRLLVDTGASCTCVDPTIIKQLGLSPSGSVPIHTPSTSPGNLHHCPQYDVSLIIVHPSLNRIFGAIPVLESSLCHQGIDGLLGRDVLSKCLLVYNGEIGLFTLAF
ncbi:MAG TPA: aspartyl protease family protein [Candidatus Competibacter sp.]|nr:aspartyl protease family protein [Candidatus Competibacter sp.]